MQMCDGEVQSSVECNAVQVQVQVQAEEGVCIKRVSQGTQAGRWSRPPPPHPLRHHASEMVLTTRVQRPAPAFSPVRLHPHPQPQHQHLHNLQQLHSQQQAPFYTTRSAYPYDNVYGTYANSQRVRRRPQPYAFLSDSPNSSLDYLPLKATDWIPDHMKVCTKIHAHSRNQQSIQK